MSKWKDAGGGPAPEPEAVARRYILDVWGRGDFEAERQTVADDIRDHNQLPGYPQGFDGHHQVVQEFQAALADVRLRIDLLLAVSDYVVVRWSMSATHRGEWLGIPPTGRRFTIPGIDILRIEDGKIRDVWHQEDELSLVQQVGAELRVDAGELMPVGVSGRDR